MGGFGKLGGFGKVPKVIGLRLAYKWEVRLQPDWVQLLWVARTMCCDLTQRIPSLF